MNIPSDEIVVLDIAGKYARVHFNECIKITKLLDFGFVVEGDQLVREIVDSEDRRSIIFALIEMSALFSGGRDWSPADVVSFYREKEGINSPYRTVAWISPDKYVIRTHS